MAQLVPCPGCGRHVFSEEPRCPFCRGEVPRTAARSRTLTARLGRAALFVAGATLMGVACEGGSSPPADGASPDGAGLTDGGGTGGGGGGSGGSGSGGRGTGGAVYGTAGFPGTGGAR
jgi:hypothetical protein